MGNSRHKRRRIPAIALSSFVMFLIYSSVLQLIAGELHYAPSPIANPLKGFVSGTSSRTDFPHTLEFRFFSLGSLMTGQDSYDWTSLETWLDAAAKRGNHGIFRVYTDWPGRETGWPAFLFAAGVEPHVLTTRPVPGDVLVNPNDPQAQAALTNFVAALGRKFDGDSRVAFIQAGLLGTWGEWLLWSEGLTTELRQQLTPQEPVRRAVLDAFAASFRKTKVQLRFPDSMNLGGPFGYHDEWFAREGLRAAYTKAGPASLEKWRAEPMGGRFHPSFRKCLWRGPSACGITVEDVLQQIDANHVSYLLLPGSFNEIGADAAPYAGLWAHRLGYEFHVPHASVNSPRNADPLQISVTITNTGVAPFYYTWKVELAAFAEGNIAATWQTDWDITRVSPGFPKTQFEHAVAQHKLSPGTYQLLIRVKNPLPNGPPVRFANETQDRHQPGWLTIGSFTIHE